MPIYTNNNGTSKQFHSIYTNNSNARKGLTNAYANIDGIDKEIFAPLYRWIKYTYYGSSTQETRPSISTWSGEGTDYTDELGYILADGLYIAPSYSINESSKTISLVNYKYLKTVNSMTLKYGNINYPSEYLSSITTVPQWTLLKSNFNSTTSSADWSDTDYGAVRVYGYRISEICVNPIEIRCTGTISNQHVRKMEYLSQTIVYSTNKNEYTSSKRSDLGSDFYLDWYNSDSGMQYFYKSI